MKQLTMDSESMYFFCKCFFSPQDTRAILLTFSKVHLNKDKLTILVQQAHKHGDIKNVSFVKQRSFTASTIDKFSMNFSFFFHSSTTLNNIIMLLSIYRSALTECSLAQVKQNKWC